MFNIKKSLLVILSLIALVVVVPLAYAQSPTTLQLNQNPTMGTILSDAQGMTLYLFTKDEPGVSNCYGDCAQIWPPLLVTEGDPSIVGDGITGQLSVIDRTDGTKQVAYNNMPLYYFAKDTAPGDVNGQNVKDVWFVVHPSIADMTVSTPMVQVTQNSAQGEILTNQGMTLYYFAKDEANLSNCYEGCAPNWPPLLSSSDAPIAGTGITGQLGLIDRTDGTKQVTYNGYPLYFFIKDSNPSETNGQGVKDVWFVVHPNDSLLTAPTQLPVTGGESQLPLSALNLGLLLIGIVALGTGISFAFANRNH